ncbi:MAG: endolytic transglycosylase MltG, partial [Caldilineales bacterium]|nr:endolytic transglycosylase MltG [Caldilineales bacterium]
MLTKRLLLALVGSLVLAVLLVGCGGDQALAVYLEANRQRLDQPLDPLAEPVEFTVAPGTPAKAIAQNLQQAGLIEDALLFEAYVRVNGLANRLEAGTYRLSAAMTPIEIAAALQNAQAPSVPV